VPDPTPAATRPDLLDLAGQIVVLSGGSGALGREICTMLAGHGAFVASVDRDPPADPDARVLDLRADVTDAGDVARAWRDSVEAAGGLPTVVCCHAGVVHSDNFADYPLAELRRVFEINVASAFALAQHAVRAWRAADVPGHVIFTSSWVQDVPWPSITPYAASKAAVRSLARGLAREYAAYGIRANVVAPGIVGAGMALRQWETEPDYRRRASRAIPLGALQTPTSVAHAFLFLCSPMASYMTGATLVVDGGASLYPLDDVNAP
jgi:NAD(P)-dependent dehydrogenase (short-subunit alcohol dehydrogenase family)